MAIILPANTLSAGGYTVANSCRFAEGDSAHLSRTFGSAGNRRTFTVSFWYKTTTKITTGQSVKFGAIFDAGADGSNSDDMYFHTDRLNFSGYYGSTQFMLRTTAKYRDPSAWTHFVVAFDTTQGVAANRIKMYANGTQITAFDEETYPAENFQTSYMNLDRLHNIGTLVNSDGFPLDGYLAEFCFIDGLALAPTSFGEFNEDSPTIWQPIDVSGLTFGTNGCYLDFEDSSNLGNDANGGTDYASTNLAATDQATDTPTNNFCTINPLYFRTGRTAATISEGNLKCVHSDSGGNTPAWGTCLLTAGSWYWEVKVSVGNYSYIGIWQPEYNDGDMSDALDGIVIYRQDGKKQAETAATAADYGDTYTGGSDIVSVAVNCDTGTIWFAKNGTWQASATEAEIEGGTTTNAAYTGKSFSKGIIPSISAYSGATHEYNFGSPPYAISSGNADGNGYGNFEYAVPDGFLAVCTKNLGSAGG